MITVNSNSTKIGKNQVPIFPNNQTIEHTSVIHFAQRNWAVIGSTESGDVSLLAIDSLVRMPFGKSQFYAKSDIRNYCSTLFDSMNDNQKSLLKPVLLDDIGTENVKDMLFIPSIEEAKNICRGLLTIKSGSSSFRTSWLRDLCNYGNIFNSNNYYGYMLDETGVFDEERLYNVTCLGYCRLACVVNIPKDMLVLNYADLLYLQSTDGRIL